jgi:hypothetical protein
MVLEAEDRKLYFKIWLKLLAFVNDTYNIIPDFGHPDNPIGLDINNMAEIRNKIWNSKSIINKYLKTNNLDDEEYKIVSSWKKFVFNNFLVIKELKKHCIFLDTKKDILYGVYGISSPFSETIPIPAMIETALIPFKGKIITDGLFAYTKLTFGRNMRISFEETYKEKKMELLSHYKI